MKKIDLSLDGFNSGNYTKCKTIDPTQLLKFQILMFTSNSFVGLEFRTLVT